MTSPLQERPYAHRGNDQTTKYEVNDVDCLALKGEDGKKSYPTFFVEWADGHDPTVEPIHNLYGCLQLVKSDMSRCGFSLLEQAEILNLIFEQQF
jgi:hypothetical protein